MVVEQTAQIRLDELNRCRDLIWSTVEDYRPADPIAKDTVSVKKEAARVRFSKLIYMDQKAFLSTDQSIGRITELLPDTSGHVAYFVIHTAHLWGKNKLLPVDLISEVNVKGVMLSIDRNKFLELPDYKTDASIADEVDRALRNDDLLRVTDYHEINVQVNQGIVSLTGHITGQLSQDRIERAVEHITGILGVKIHLVADNDLLLEVAEALVQVDRVNGNHVFANVQNGVVILSGEVINPEARSLAEQCTANVPRIRAVINSIAAPGIDLDAMDQRFLQPAIGEEIVFRDGLSGLVKQVIINRNNRRVVGMIIQGRFPDKPLQFGSIAAGENLTPERLAVIPVSVLRYLTNQSGFLLIDSTETTRYQDYDPANFVVPDPDWVPPYPYCSENVRFDSK